MLVQSHRKDAEGNWVIDLLPAVPEEWASGSVKGLCARGDFELDMQWEEGEIVSVTISSERGGSSNVRFKDSIIALTLEPGEEKSLTGL
jgi:alpha-L-fucosidase 2